MVVEPEPEKPPPEELPLEPELPEPLPEEPELPPEEPEPELPPEPEPELLGTGFGLIVTLHLAFTPLAMAKIVTVPAFFAVTLPFLLTVARALLEDFHVTFLDFPLTVALSVKVFPAVRVYFFLEIFVVGFLTVTVQILVSFSPLHLM